jgi:hypothetical protein
MIRNGNSNCYQHLTFSLFYFFLQKAAIKKIDTQSSKEFLAELKVLAEVHHLNFGMTFSQH